jgi:hypothetical protein
MLKLIPENSPLPDELKLIETAKNSPDDYISDEEVDWENLDKYL